MAETVAFSEAQKEISEVAKALGLDEKQVECTFEKNQFLVRTQITEVSDEILVDVIALAKRHIENWRIHTFERGFLSLQALNENLFSTEGLLQQLKLRLSGIGPEKQCEITKRSELTRAELAFVSSLLKYFHSKKESRDPLDLLETAGCSVYRPQEKQPTFSEFAGYEPVKNQIKEAIILPLKNPHVYDNIAQQTRVQFESNRPRAVLFSGPPGVGKTTMARIIAAEAAFPLVYMPLENIMSAYYGESSKRLASIFDLAAKAAGNGLVLFLDEIDSLAPSRSEKLFEATRRMLSVLLRKIEGIESLGNVLTVGATNRPEDLDAALVSRFDTQIEFPSPSKEDIAAILGLYAKQLGAEERAEIATRYEGLSPRNIKDLCQRAERICAREAIAAGEDQPKAPSSEHYLKALVG